jgi:hypothetical protein
LVEGTENQSLCLGKSIQQPLAIRSHNHTNLLQLSEYRRLAPTLLPHEVTKLVFNRIRNYESDEGAEQDSVGCFGGVGPQPFHAVVILDNVEGFLDQILLTIFCNDFRAVEMTVGKQNKEIKVTRIFVDLIMFCSKVNVLSDAKFIVKQPLNSLAPRFVKWVIRDRVDSFASMRRRMVVS